MTKIAGTLPVRTRLPITAWVLGGLVALFSLMQVNVAAEQAMLIAEQATKPAKEPYHASLTDMLGALRAL
jgi:hypothetical protein